MYNRIIKLISGDELLAQIAEDVFHFEDSQLVELHHPMLVNYYRTADKNGRVYQGCSINPWINMTDDSIIHIKGSSILAVARLSQETSNKYEEYIRVVGKEDSEEYSYLNELMDYITSPDCKPDTTSSIIPASFPV